MYTPGLVTTAIVRFEFRLQFFFVVVSLSFYVFRVSKKFYKTVEVSPSRTRGNPSGRSSAAVSLNRGDAGEIDGGYVIYMPYLGAPEAREDSRSCCAGGQGCEEEVPQSS